MTDITVSRDLVLEPEDNARLANLSGQFDEHLRQIERRLDIEIANRGNHFRVVGAESAARKGEHVLRQLFELTNRERLDPEHIHICLQESGMQPAPGDKPNQFATGSNNEFVWRVCDGKIRFVTG
ncbi:MAG: hypothetical protein AAGM16_15775, partial [Pseudomonadota bacterium]